MKKNLKSNSTTDKKKSKKQWKLAILIFGVIGILFGFYLIYIEMQGPPPYDFRASIVYYILLSIFILILIGYVFTKDNKDDEEHEIYEGREPIDSLLQRRFAPPDW